MVFYRVGGLPKPPPPFGMHSDAASCRVKQNNYLRNGWNEWNQWFNGSSGVSKMGMGINKGPRKVLKILINMYWPQIKIWQMYIWSFFDLTFLLNILILSIVFGWQSWGRMRILWYFLINFLPFETDFSWDLISQFIVKIQKKIYAFEK